MKKCGIERALREVGIENAPLEAMLLFEAFEGDRLARAVARRCERYPLQYIL